MKSLSLTAACLATVVAVSVVEPAFGAETTINYMGTVAATPDPSQAFDLMVGTPVEMSVTFDPDRLVDVSSTFYNIDADSGLPVAIPGLRAASLSDDPDAAFTVTLGAHSFTKTDASNYGTPGDDLGVGNFPVVFYQGSTFEGVAFFTIAEDGFLLQLDPVAQALHYAPTYGVGGDFNSPSPAYGFLITTDLPPLQTAAVPEPAGWATMMLGFGLLGQWIRRSPPRGARHA